MNAWSYVPDCNQLLITGLSNLSFLTKGHSPGVCTLGTKVTLFLYYVFFPHIHILNSSRRPWLIYLKYIDFKFFLLYFHTYYIIYKNILYLKYTSLQFDDYRISIKWLLTQTLHFICFVCVCVCVCVHTCVCTCVQNRGNLPV